MSPTRRVARSLSAATIWICSTSAIIAGRQQTSQAVLAKCRIRAVVSAAERVRGTDTDARRLTPALLAPLPATQVVGLTLRAYSRGVGSLPPGTPAVCVTQAPGVHRVCDLPMKGGCGGAPPP